MVSYLQKLVFIFIPLTLKDISASAQRAWVEATELRVGTTASVLRSIKGIKMSGLSEMIGARLQALRVSEMKISSRSRTVLSGALTISVMSQVLIPFVTLISSYLIHNDGSLHFDTTNAFTTLTLVALLANPIQEIARAVPEAAAASGCMQRIQEYLCSEEMAKNQHEDSDSRSSMSTGTDIVLDRSPHIARKLGDKETILRMTEASFALWSRNEPILRNISIKINPSSWTVLTGPIGCGKSLLLLAMVNELRLIEGSIERHPSTGIGYCGQDPWLPNLSIRQVITLEDEFDEKRYWAVVNACLLDRDIRDLPAADHTEIGSNGVSLSGGQRQRLSLARALYSRKSLLLLDDVLGGLDASTEEAVVDNVFGNDGFLRRNNMAAILVSHSSKLGNFHINWPLLY